jgi:lipoyl-dependent peroxiredoxin
MKIIYKTRATAAGGRSGHSQLDDGSLGFDLAKPGSGKVGTNPEQLFAIGYAACFDSALELTARQMKKAIAGSTTSIEVGLGQTSEGGYVLDIDIYVVMQGLPEAEARELVEATHRICPYSNATRGNVDVRLHVSVPVAPAKDNTIARDVQ